MSQSQYGRIILFNDFTGEECPVAQLSLSASATGGLWNIGGGFAIKGDALNDAQGGAPTLSDGLNGQITLTSANVADGDACYVTTETCFKPSVNGTLVLETRLEMAALTARRVWAGFAGTMIAAQSDHVTGATSTLTLTEANMCGFLYDVGLTTDIEWHFVHNGGSVTGVTDSLLLNSGVTPVINTMDVLRVEIDNNGTARWYINGVLLKTLAGAVSTTAVFAGCVGALATSAVSGTCSVDYIAVEANRDWTV